MGSEMCIRDRVGGARGRRSVEPVAVGRQQPPAAVAGQLEHPVVDCLLYTSDAADERSSVDLGGRRIIKKKSSREPR